MRIFLHPPRRLWHLYPRWTRLATSLLLIILSLDFLQTISLNPPLVRVSPSSTSSNVLRNERIFIASMHWNTEHILRSHWNAAVLELVAYFGADNIYISIVESGSWDNTTGALRDLDGELGKRGVERSMQFVERSHRDEVERIPGLDEEGWIWTTRGRRELRRIPYLAKLRNGVMEKMKLLAERTDGGKKRSFDKILWLNDVIFTTEDVITLMATRDGHYAAVCALDFSNPPLFYDTFALRDILGSKPITQTWPFFLAAKSRNALMSSSPVPVQSCWNGIVVFQADAFYKSPWLRFRGIQDSLAAQHLEGSECCLIHADNKLGLMNGVWMNPNVRVSYNSQADEIVNSKRGWPSKREVWMGIWWNRWARWSGFPSRYAERFVVERRVRRWRNEAQQIGHADVNEEGVYCLVNEMQVLVENGWAHV